MIAIHLLLRGESPSQIRILDVRPQQLAKLARLQRVLDTAARDRLAAQCEQVQYIQTDITNPDSIASAFSEPWTADVKDQPLTVFHTAAIIRHWERKKSLLPLTTGVNVDGTKNVLAAARKAGADVFISTSSGSVLVKPMGFWVWPWQNELKNFALVLDGGKEELVDDHAAYAGNYPYSKAMAEKAVRAANDPQNGFKTGVIRPCSGIYGSGGDVLAGSYLKRGGGPT